MSIKGVEVLLVHDKHDTYIEAHDDGVEMAALELLRDRLNQGWYYDNWDDGNPRHQWEDRAKRIAESDSEKAPAVALRFLKERSDHEYEYVEVKTL